jgi:hypothetical protein
MELIDQMNKMVIYYQGEDNNEKQTIATGIVSDISQ